jgi:hypothetical protein
VRDEAREKKEADVPELNQTPQNLGSNSSHRAIELHDPIREGSSFVPGNYLVSEKSHNYICDQLPAVNSVIGAVLSYPN